MGCIFKKQNDDGITEWKKVNKFEGVENVFTGAALQKCVGITKRSIQVEHDVRLISIRWQSIVSRNVSFRNIKFQNEELEKYENCVI